MSLSPGSAHKQATPNRSFDSSASKNLDSEFKFSSKRLQKEQANMGELSPLDDKLATGQGPLYSSFFDENDKLLKEIPTTEGKRAHFDSKLSYISDTTPLKSEKKKITKRPSQIIQTTNEKLATPDSNLKPSIARDEYSTIALEKITNLKELSREIYKDYEKNKDDESNKGNLSERSRISPRTILGHSPKDSKYEHHLLNSNNPIRRIQTETDNPFINTKSSQAYYSFKDNSEHGSALNSERANTLPDMRPASTQKPPLVKFTFEKPPIKENEGQVANAKLNSSFTLGRHPKLSPPKSNEVSFQKDGSYRQSRASSIKSSPEKLQGIRDNSNSQSRDASNQGSPRSMHEMKTPLNESANDSSNVRNSGNFDNKIKDLIEKNTELRNQLAKQARAANKYRESAATIKQLQSQVASLQSQLLQTEIQYQTKINILKQNQQKFLPQVPGNVQDVQGVLAAKDKVIEDLHNMIADLKSSKQELEKQVRDLSAVQMVSKNEASVTEITNPKYMDSYISRLENEVKFLKAQISQTPAQAEFIKFSQYLGLFSSRSGRYLLGIYTGLKGIKSRVFGRKKPEVIQSVEDLLDYIEKNSSDEKDVVITPQYLNQVIENCISLSQIVGQGDWRESEKVVLETEDITIQEFGRLDVNPSAQENVLISDESVFYVSKTQNTVTDRYLQRKTAREQQQAQRNTSQNQDASIRGTQRQTHAETKKAQVQEAEDIILSDYSDEEFDVEDVEEKASLDFVFKFKEFLEESRISEREIKKLWETNFEESIEDTKDVEPAKLFSLLAHRGLEGNIHEFTGMVLRLENLNLKTGLVDWKLMISNVRTKNNLWWKNKIHNSSFDLKYKSWNLGHILTDKNGLRHLLFECVAGKLISYFKANDLEQKIEQINSAIDTEHVTKKKIRAIFLAHKLPFTKLETQIITVVLDSNHQNMISTRDFFEFLETGQLNSFYTRYVIAKGSSHKILENNEKKFNEIIGYLRDRIEDDSTIDKVRVRDVFKMKDTRFSGQLNYQQFCDCCDDSDLPFSRPEDVRIVFDVLSKRIAHPNSTTTHSHVIEYKKFLEIVLEKSPKGPQSQNGSTFGVLEERDLKYQILLLENQLKDAQHKIKDFEENQDKLKTREMTNGQHENAENMSILSNLPQGKSIAGDKTVKNRSNKAFMFSNERTLSLKVEDLEYENAKLRKQNQEHTSRLENLESQRKSYEETCRKFEELKGSGSEAVTLRNLESKLENVEKNYILREVELKSEINRLQRAKQEEIEILKKTFAHERDDFKKIIDEKNKEINSFRSELEEILIEMDTLRKQTVRGTTTVTERSRLY